MELRVELQYDFEYQGFVVNCPSLTGCMSQGKTKEEALKNIQEAIQGYVKVLKKHHQTVPLEAIYPHYIKIPI